MARESAAVVTAFLPGDLISTLNARLHWAVQARYARRWREHVELALRGAFASAQAVIRPAQRIVLEAHVHNRYDAHDNLRAALKPAVDGLAALGLFGTPRDDEGAERVVHYTQRVDRRRRGVQITITL